jgi:hypothetical protein
MSEEVQKPGPVDTSNKDPSYAAQSAVTETKPEPKQEAEGKEVQETVTEQEDTEGSATSERDDSPEQRQNKGVGKRINELTRKAGDADRARQAEQQAHEATRRELAELREQLKKAAPAKESEPVKAVDSDEMPTLEDADFDYTAWQKNLTEWNRKQLRKELEQEKQEEVKKARFQTYQQRADEFANEHPDYADKINSLMVSATMREAIMETDIEPQIAYHLANNPSETQAMLAKSAPAQAFAIGQLAERLKAKPAPELPQVQPKTVTNAPPPVRTLSGSPVARKSYDEMSMAEYDKARKEERAAKGFKT